MIVCPNCGELGKEQIHIFNSKLRKQNFAHTPILPTCKLCGAEVEITHRCNGGNIIVLNGTCGSGKSTIAELMQKRGFWSIDGDCAIQSARYKRNGEKVDFRGAIDEIAYEIDILSLYSQNIVLATIIVPEDLEKYRSLFKERNLKYKFILLKPNYETAVERCQSRTCHCNVTPEYWIEHFYNLLKFDKQMEVIDNTDMTPEETAERIIMG